MKNNRFDYDDERNERIWRLVIGIIMIPVSIAIISSTIKILNQ